MIYGSCSRACIRFCDVSVALNGQMVGIALRTFEVDSSIIILANEIPSE
jgi:hypothetical protein